MATSKEQGRRVRDYRARQAVFEQRRRRTKRDSIIGIALAAIVLIGGATAIGLRQAGTDADAAASASPSAPATATPSPQVSSVPDPSTAEGRTWTGALTINDVELGVELDGAAAPQAVAAVLGDVRSGYFEGKTCHRLTTMEGFAVLQCGSLDGTGASDPSFQYGPIENAPADDVYPAGTIAMARAGTASGLTPEEAAHSSGHQFFIVYEDSTIPADDAGGYTVVGRVTSGLDALVSDVVSLGTQDDAPDGAPASPVTIEGFTLE